MTPTVPVLPKGMPPLTNEEMVAMIAEWRESNRQKGLRENYVEPVDANIIANPRMGKPPLPYPRILYGPNATTMFVQDEEEHQFHLAKGWSETPLRSHIVALANGDTKVDTMTDAIDTEWQDSMEQRLNAQDQRLDSMEGTLGQILEAVKQLQPKTKKASPEAA